MKLLSKPAHLDYSKQKNYEEFRFFQLALTERNWSGKEYITKEDCSWFMQQLKDLDDVFYKLFGNILSTTRFTFLMDTSIFAGKLPENNKLIEFLEELDDFQEYDIENPDEVKKANKYLNKLKSYKNKIENLTYIYRWALNNEEHPFASEIKELVIKEVEKKGNLAKTLWDKDISKVALKRMKLIKQGASQKEFEAKLNSEGARLVTECEKRDIHFVSQILRYGLDEPSLFFYGIYFIVIYYKQLEGLMKPGIEFISFEKKENKIEVFLKDSTGYLDEQFLKHETFISTLPKVKRRADGRVTKYESLYDVNGAEFDNEEQIKGVLRTISNWIIHRIPSDTTIKLPNKKWVHTVKGDLFTSLGLDKMYFEQVSFIGGPEGPELLIKAHAFLKKGTRTEDLLFPLFDPESWENLNAIQCSIITYALCLFHDITIEKNYDLVKNTFETFLGEIFEYELVTREKSGSVSALQLLKESQKTGNKNNYDTNTNHEDAHKKTEHWVSFHFRRLKTGSNASDKQKSVAAKYGIKELPPGFTFVDSHVRGERNIDKDNIHFSALDILNKTLGKLNRYYEENHDKEQEITN